MSRGTRFVRNIAQYARQLRIKLLVSIFLFNAHQENRKARDCLSRLSVAKLVGEAGIGAFAPPLLEICEFIP
jgi:hypothetical protein